MWHANKAHSSLRPRIAAYLTRLVNVAVLQLVPVLANPRASYSRFFMLPPVGALVVDRVKILSQRQPATPDVGDTDILDTKPGGNSSFSLVCIEHAQTKLSVGLTLRIHYGPHCSRKGRIIPSATITGIRAALCVKVLASSER